MSIDKNLPALLDENAYTVACTYNKTSKRYVFVTNIQPKLIVGDTVFVLAAAQTEADNSAPIVDEEEIRAARQLVDSYRTEFRLQNLGASWPLDGWLRQHGALGVYTAAAQVINRADSAESGARTFREFSCVRVVEVHDTVQIEPGSDIRYKWLAGKIDGSYFDALMVRNSQILTAYGEAYKSNVRRSFAQQVLGGLDADTANSIKSLLTLAAPTINTNAGEKQ